MTLFTFSADGTTPGPPRPHEPRTSRDLTTGEWVMLNADSSTQDRERCGWYPITEVARPDADHLRSITHDGSVFTETWTFDQATADANADQSDRDADAVALKDDLQNAKDVRDEAAQSRADMDPAGPPLPKWEPLTGTGNQAARIEALEALVNDLLVDQRRQYGDIRVIGAMLVRKFRKDRDDE